MNNMYSTGVDFMGVDFMGSRFDLFFVYLPFFKIIE